MLELKDITALIETGAYTREVRRIVRAIRWTIQLRKKLNVSVLTAFLNSVFVPGSEVHSRLASYIPKVTMALSSWHFMLFNQIMWRWKLMHVCKIKTSLSTDVCRRVSKIWKWI